MAARAHMSCLGVSHRAEARTLTVELFATGAFMAHNAELARSDARKRTQFAELPRLHRREMRARGGGTEE
jgi:hypothetical protein